MTEVYYNFAGTTVDPEEIAAQIKTEISQRKPAQADPISDKFTIRTVARVTDTAFTEFLEEVGYRLSVSLGSSTELDFSRFEFVYDSICDILEDEISRNDDDDDEEEESFLPYSYDEYDDYDEEEDEDYDLDPEDYDFENPRY